jgi:pimeloyl-ACP methyl ester carboxylesterase
MTVAAKPIPIAAFATINGHRHWLTFRGRDARNPVLLIVGGPGGALSAWTPFFEPWEETFTLVQWDQPGAGSTDAVHPEALEPYTLERLTADLIGAAEALTERLGGLRPIVLGFSGGSILGLQAAHARPDVMRAFVGCGQIVCWPRQTALGYRRLLDRARNEGDLAASADLERIGPPPWVSIEDEIAASKHTVAPTPAELEALARIDAKVLAEVEAPKAEADYVAPGARLGNARMLATQRYARLRDAIAAFDAWTLGTTFDVPIVFLQGEHDMLTTTPEVERYARELRAPHVAVNAIPGASHAGFLQRTTFLRRLAASLRAVLAAEA